MNVADPNPSSAQRFAQSTNRDEKMPQQVGRSFDSRIEGMCFFVGLFVVVFCQNVDFFFFVCSFSSFSSSSFLLLLFLVLPFSYCLSLVRFVSPSSFPCLSLFFSARVPSFFKRCKCLVFFYFNLYFIFRNKMAIS